MTSPNKPETDMLDEIRRLVEEDQRYPGDGQPYANGNSRAGHPEPGRKILKPRQPLGRDRKSLTERAWAIERFAMRGELTALIAPPGAGKTTLAQQVMHAASAGGMEWGGFTMSDPLKVAVFHWEDDEPEMDRKVQAIEDVMGKHPHPENLITIYCGASDETDDDLILATYNGRTDKFTPTLGFNDVDAVVAEHRPDIVVFDPLANTFEGPEGNELLKKMARLMRRLARRRDVAVIVILHTKKYADGNMAGNMDAGRNAGTLVGRVRVGLTLFPMTEEEAQAHDIQPPTRRHRFVRLDDGKQSYGARTDTSWFEIVETMLPIDENQAVSVGTFKPWEPKPLFRGIPTDTIHAILRDIDKGVVIDGMPTEFLYMPGQNATHWAGDVILKHVPDCSKARAKQILARWKKEGLLKAKSFKDAHRDDRQGLVSVPSKWPGTTT